MGQEYSRSNFVYFFAYFFQVRNETCIYGSKGVTV